MAHTRVKKPHILLFLFPALAAEPSPWLSTVEARLDSALPTLRSCVTFTHAVQPDRPERVHLELVLDSGRPARVTVEDTTFEPRHVATCIADKLRLSNWPEPPHWPAAAGFTLALGTEEVHRLGAVFAAPPLPAELADTAALGREAFRLRLGKIKFGARCLRSRVVANAEDISARFEAQSQLQADGRLKLSEVTGGAEDATLRTCLVEELERARFPAGYPATPPAPLVVEMTARRTGAALSGPFAGWQADGGWKWRTVVWVRGKQVGGGSASAAPVSSPARWLLLGQRALSRATRNIEGCVLRSAEQRADLELLLVAGPGGVEEVVVTGAAGSQSCVAAAIAEAAIPAMTTRIAAAARFEVVAGPTTIHSGLGPLNRRPGVWSPAIEAAIEAGDAAPFAAALPPDAAQAGKPWQPATLTPTPDASWRFGGAWPEWPRLVAGPGAGDATEREADHWAAELSGCIARPAPGSGKVWTVVAMHVDTAGVVHVDAPVEHTAGADALRCIQDRLEGQRLAAIGPGYSAFWTARP